MRSSINFNIIILRRLKLSRNYKCLEPIVVNVKIGKTEWIILECIRQQKNLSGNYQLLLEDELSHICNWASLQRACVAVIDLNLDRLRPLRSEGK